MRRIILLVGEGDGNLIFTQGERRIEIENSSKHNKNGAIIMTYHQVEVVKSSNYFSHFKLCKNWHLKSISCYEYCIERHVIHHCFTTFLVELRR